jgi:acyl-coenzyme A thioesterase PaaI-like protein
LVHHELCFGCGRTNVFGLLLDAEQTAPGSVAGRAFVKQDHQGATPGQAHEGVIAAALTEAMSFAVGPEAHLRTLELELLGTAPVGAFLDLEAHVEGRDGPTIHTTAIASSEAQPVARTRATYA